MVDNLFENHFFLDSKEALELIQQLFKSNLPSFKLVKIFDKSIYFSAEYGKDDVEIMFGGGRGFFEHRIIIGGQEFSLRHFEKNMDNVQAVSEKNIHFAFDILKRFLSEKNIIK